MIMRSKKRIHTSKKTDSHTGLTKQELRFSRKVNRIAASASYIAMTKQKQSQRVQCRLAIPATIATPNLIADRSRPTGSMADRVFTPFTDLSSRLSYGLVALKCPSF